MLEVKFSNSAIRFLDGCDDALRERVLKEIESLRTDPFYASLKLKGKNLYRILVGKYRVVYQLNAPQHTLIIHVIANRENVYS